MAAGSSTEVVLAPGLGGCLYDLKAGFANGAEAQLFAVNVCRLDGRTLVLTD